MAPHEKLIATFDKIYEDDSTRLKLYLGFVTFVMLAIVVGLLVT